MYKWDAEEYHKSSSEQQKWAQELILKLELKGSERVLDIGCGEGKVTAELAKLLSSGSVLGIDNSEEQIRFARKNFPSKKFPNIAFRMMDASNLSFNGEFDVVFSNATLHWVIDHLPVLKGIKKSLKPSGKILLQMGGRGNAAKILKVMEPMMKSKKWSKYFANFTFPYGFYGPEEYKDWLEQVGLKAKRVELIPKDMVQKGKEGLSAWVRTTWLPYTQRVPEDMREEFIKELVDKYVENHPLDKDGFVHVPMMRLEVEAENRNKIPTTTDNTAFMR
jgi:trans-aconitate 2-methyltransferase